MRRSTTGSQAAWILTLVTVAIAYGCASEASEPAPADDVAGDVGHARQPLVGGTATSARPEVGQLRIQRDNVISKCTGTLLADRYVLTAGHCVPNPQITASVEFVITDASGTEHRYDANRWHKFGSYGGALFTMPDRFGRDDVGVYEIEPVPSSVATGTHLLAVRPDSGTQTIFGYGCQNREDGSGGGFKQYYSFERSDTTSVLCRGDSGGPVVQGAHDGSGAVWGVNASYDVNSGTDSFGNATWYKDQILQVIQGWTTQNHEQGINRFGMDYDNFNGSHWECEQRCKNDPKCQAYTHVTSTQTCWMKSALADWSFCADCNSNSGVRLGIEVFVNRIGGDYRNLTVPDGRWDICQAECARDRECKAYTYVVPGVQGADAHCWLKNSIPDPTGQLTTLSGVKRDLEVDVNRYGGDYDNLQLAGGDAHDCKQACAEDQRCRAFSWVDWAETCWLKDEVVAPSPAAGITSGVKGGKEMNIERRGSTYAEEELLLYNVPEMCQSLCARDDNCLAYTFVPSYREDNRYPLCRLKDGIPSPQSSPGYISGVKGLEFF